MQLGDLVRSECCVPGPNTVLSPTRSINEYKKFFREPNEILGGGNLVMEGIPSRGE